MRKLWSGVILAILLVAGCDRGQHPSQIGHVAPTFDVSDGGHSVDLSKLRGDVVVLNFWATWCAPCIEELPSLVAMQHQMPQIKVLAISTDEDADAYREFLTKHPLDGLNTIRDGQQRANALYGTFRYPETYVIDRKGIIRRKFIGPQDWTSPEIMAYLKKL